MPEIKIKLTQGTNTKAIFENTKAYIYTYSMYKEPVKKLEKYMECKYEIFSI